MFSKLKEIKDRILKGYTRYDLMDIDYWFQTVFVNMLSDFEKSIIGGPGFITIEDLKEYDINWINENYKDIIKTTSENSFFEKFKDLNEFENQYFEDGIYDHFIGWKLILRRIIYCLRECSDDQCSIVSKYWDEYYEKAYNSNKDINLIEPLEEDLETKILKEKWLQEEEEISKYKEKMKDEAFSLLSKWFFALWN